MVFDDGEYKEFDTDEMEYFLLVKPRPAHKLSTYANQVTVTGFYPKGTRGLNTVSILHGPSVLHGLNAISIFDEELHKWTTYRDLIKHPNEKVRD